MSVPTKTPRSSRPTPATGRPGAAADAVNQIRLVGRLSAPPAVKHLPSGAEVVQLRVVVDRPTAPRARSGGDTPRTPKVDTIDLACWSAQTRRRALSCTGTEIVDVSGALRRRFWRGGSGVASRYEVEVERLQVVKRAS